MIYTKEEDFERDLVQTLTSQKGWSPQVLRYPTEEELIQNWADILLANNKSIDRLNNIPLTKSEMNQLMEQIVKLRTPIQLNGFINGGSVSIVRDNPADTLHYGRSVSLKIYDRREIAGGQSMYQIAEQPVFSAKNRMLQSRRGDVMLLINGMPVIHIELKKSGIPVSQACWQIEKYAHEGVFTGLFSLVQIFVAMTPEETVYFANPGPDGRFNRDYFFHWADFNNEPINDWQAIASSLLSIPMAHEMIGFYTITDYSDGVLKVLRSYQYYAANAISDQVAKTRWDEGDHRLGGYIWHTTGSGKTMTSFKTAQLIADSNDADKVIFLLDRIELGIQSVKEYRSFAGERQSVQDTKNTKALIAKLKSDDTADTLIVTSIQKMSNIREDGLNGADLAAMQQKRIVFIIDEAHRSTFGDMLAVIKETFPQAIFFGFTGTPIMKENEKKKNTTTSVFGNELHRYTLADGIRDKNVLGFDPYMVQTYKERDVREAVALREAKASTVEEALADPKKCRIYDHFMNASVVPMAAYTEKDGESVRGIESYVPRAQYEQEEHRRMVITDMLENWTRLSRNRKFHAMLAVSSIREAGEYYHLFKTMQTELHIACLFDSSIDNNGGAIAKEDMLVEMLTDYNAMFGQEYTIPTYDRYKKDVAARLAHKMPYVRLQPGQELDLLIVVDQMLTGFDSKWVNTLYLDKVLRYEGLIQAFSRTNRLFGPDKPFGTIRYYRYPHTMAVNIQQAVKAYSGDAPAGLFVDHLEQNTEKMKEIFVDMRRVFAAESSDFSVLPNDPAAQKKFAADFKKFNEYLQAARIQGFTWEEGGPAIDADEHEYTALLQRYKEMVNKPRDPIDDRKHDDVPFDIEGYLTEIDTEAIDAEYMNSRFEKYLRVLHQEHVGEEEMQATLNDLHRSFASLSKAEQKYADLFLHDVQSGSVTLVPGKTFRDYVMEYMKHAKDAHIHRFAADIGCDEAKLQALVNAGVTEKNINEFGRFDELKKTVVREKAAQYIAKKEHKPLPPMLVNVKVDQELRNFVLRRGKVAEDEEK
ncbi:type I restriction endonuclease subunit R [uncultured Megasphaera sp.]|uniref:type I restriction endonuclease subunit R n=1 Tax=uncultured Megasphaera sp. TaxID=165188 RepID=UPI00265A31CF|nr:HsdR family type I site-specific deoxyribonuclease [uncultured Megasphaera sp.]